MKPLIEVKERESGGNVYFLVAVGILFTFLLYIAVNPNPGKKQTTLVFNAALAAPILSVPSGFYSQVFQLTIEIPKPGAQIYYTLDGSKPTIFSQLYEGPIIIESKETAPNRLSEIKNSPVFFAPIETVFKGTVVRAVAVQDSLVGQEAVGSYFISPKGRDRYTLPVFSLVSDEENFFGYKSGIYINGATTDDKDYYIKNNIKIDNYKDGFPTNYKRRGANWERPVNLALFEKGSNNGFQQQAGTRIHGNATRERPQKSLKFYFVKPFADSTLHFPLFGEQGRRQYHTFLLRNSGQDMYRAKMRDALMQQIYFNQTQVDLQQYRPSVLFINGEYWGIHDIRERIDEYYFLEKYQIPQDSLVLVGPRNIVEYGDYLDSKPWVDLLKFAFANDLQSSKNYEVISSKIDIDNFIDYIIAELYCGNPDWPNNNVNTWRYKRANVSADKQPKDGRWRWALYDTDLGFGAERAVSHSSIKSLLARKGTLGEFLKKLLANKQFRDQFFARYDYHLNNTFRPDRVLGIISKIVSELKPEMQEHLNRWRMQESLKAWKQEVAIVQKFVKERPGFQRKELNELKKQYQ